MTVIKQRSDKTAQIVDRLYIWFDFKNSPQAIP